MTRETRSYRRLVAVVLVVAGWTATLVAGQASAEIQRAARPVRDAYIVTLKNTSAAQSESQAKALSRQYEGSLGFVYKRALTGFSVRMPESRALALSRHPSVAAVEEDGKVQAEVTQTSPPSWGLDRVDQNVLPLNQSYSYSADGAGVTAYILDTGIRTTHKDFGGRASVGFDAVGDGRNGADCKGHGTHVAGTVGGAAYGVAKAVKLVAVRVLDCNGFGYWSQVIAGIDWVTANKVLPAVANMSLGGDASSALDTAVGNSVASGVSYSVSAGNGNSSGVAQDACTRSPARVGPAMTVSATDATDQKAGWANYGTCVDLFGPGVSIKSDAISSDTATTTMSGTSMATPHVSGVAAQYLQANPTASPATVSLQISTNASAGVVRSGGAGTPNKLLFSGASEPIPPVVASDSPVPATTAVGLYAPVDPYRILDTRTGAGGYSSPVGQGQSIDVQAAGVGGVPADGASAVALNVTVTSPTVSSSLTVYPSGSTRPLSPNLYFTAGQTIPNLVITKVGAGGKVSIFNAAGSVQVIADVQGWYSDGSDPALKGGLYAPLTPSRTLDTRDGTGGYSSPVGQGQSIDVQVAGVGGVPADGVSAVVLNVTVTSPTASSYLTVHPSGSTRPLAANLNFTAGLTIPNLVVAKVGAGGKVSIFNAAGSVQVIADVQGWYSDGADTAPAGGLYAPLTPSRILDTRTGAGGYSSPIGQGQSIDVQATGVGGVPADGVSAVVLNVTVTSPTASSYLTVHPSGSTRPLAANLNFTAGLTIPNLVVAKVGAGGKVSIFNAAGSVQVIADVQGWYSQ